MRFDFVDGPRKGESVEVNKNQAVIGRDPSVDVVLDDDEVSRKHAQVTVDGDVVEVRDLGSQNGTSVGGSKVRDAQVISASDEVSIGGSTFRIDAGVVGATRAAGGTRGGTRGAGGGGTRLASGVPAMAEVVRGPDQGKTIEVTSSGVTIGREDSADVKLDDDEISREHVELKTREDGSVEVTDLGSRNGTAVDGRQISKSAVVSDGAEITIGRTKLKVSTTARSGRRAAAASASRGSGPDKRVIAAIVGGIAVVVVALLVAGVFSGDDDEGSDEALTTPELVSKVGPSTVQVSGRNAGRTFPLGTGWVLDNEEGLIVTNAHVVEGTPTGPDGTPIPVTSLEIRSDGVPQRADVHAVAPCEDLAVLRVGGISDLPNLELGSQTDVVEGQKAVALGYAGNLANRQELPLQANEGTVSVSELRAQNFEGDPDFSVYENVVQMDTPINGGNSGGPLVNDQGQLIGVNTLAGDQNQNYAIGVDRVKEITDQMRTGDSIGWAGFGIEGTGTGLVVSKVFPDTGTGQQGFPTSVELTDPIFYPQLAQIRAINNRPVSTRGDYCNAVENLEAGETAVIRFGFAGANLRAARAKGRIVFE